MAFRVKALWRRQANVTADAVTYRRAYRVWQYTGTPSNVIASTEDSILDAAISAVGDIGDGYPGASGILLNDIQVDGDERSEFFTVEFQWETPSVEEQTPDDFDEFIAQSNTAPPGGGQPDTNVLGPKFSGGSTVIETYREKDLDGEPFINSANDAFQNIPSIPVTIQMDRVTFNSRSKPDTSQAGLCDGRRMLASIQYDAQMHVNRSTGVRTTYYSNTFEVWTHPSDNWHEVGIIDRGYKQLIDGQKEPIKEGRGKQDIQQPALLDGNGRKLDGNNPNPHYIYFRIRRKGPFTVPFWD